MNGRIRVAPAPAGRAAGRALPESVRARMEAAFGADFSGVTVREDGAAAAMDAIAYTRGETIAVAPGWYDPYSQDGLEVLGHELAHVLQQRAARVPGSGVTEDPALEAEAHAAGRRAARGQPVAAQLPADRAAPVGAGASGGGESAAPAQPMKVPGFLRRLLGSGRSSGGTQNEGETPYQPIPQFTENPYDLLPADFNERAPAEAENPYDLLPADFNERLSGEPEYDPESDPIYNTLPAAALKELVEGPYHTIPPELLAQQNAARLARYGTRPPPLPPPRPTLARYPQTPPPKHVRFRKGLELGPSGSGNPNRRAAAPARGILRKPRG